MKILLGTDGSRYALAAARFVGRWCAGSGTHVDLVTAIPNEPANARRNHGRRRSVEERWRAPAGRWQNRTSAPLSSQGCRVERIVRVADAADLLPEMADRNDYDLVVMGARGRGDTPYFGAGSVALAVLERAPASVLLVREREPKARRRGFPSPEQPFRVVLPTDGSPHPRNAYRRFFALFDLSPLEVEVLAAVSDPAAATAGKIPPARLRKLRAEAEGAAAKHVHVIENDIAGKGVPVSSRVLEGEAEPAIVERAEQLDADLLVLGSRGAPDEREAWAETVATGIARSAPCSVLVVRDPEAGKPPSATRRAEAVRTGR